MPTTIAITGATGFLGREIVKELLARGHAVRGLVRSRDKASKTLPSSDQLRLIEGDILDSTALAGLTAGVHACINAVGLIREVGGQTFRKMHVDATRHLVNAARDSGVKRYVQVSALGVSPEGKAEYQRTKYDAEQIVRKSDLDWTILRPSMIHGQHSSFIELAKGWCSGNKQPWFFLPYFSRGRLSSEDVPGAAIYREAASVQPVAVEDVAWAAAECLKKEDAIGEVYNLTGPEVLSWPELLDFVLPSVMDSYRQMRAAIDDDDVDGLLRLVAWLRSRSQWEAALTELDQALKVQPDHPQALELKVQIDAQRELARSAGKGKRPPPVKVAQQEAPENMVPLLSDRDINLIKVYEVDLADPPRMVIDRDTIKALIEEHEGDPLIPGNPEARNGLFRASPAKLLDIMFRMQARNLYERVKVIDQPRSMKLFRDRVHSTWLINACATTQCHGGNEAGRLMLATTNPRSDATVYTNFLILDRYRTRDDKPLINYDKPEDSLLIQSALDREHSRNPHPEVPGRQGNADLFRPAFRTEDDPRFRDALNWIKAMYRPRPEYPVQYTLPGPQGIDPPKPDEPPVQR